jgi:hypothetical protein
MPLTDALVAKIHRRRGVKSPKTMTVSELDERLRRLGA